MKLYFTTAILCVLGFSSFAQRPSPVQWDITKSKLDDGSIALKFKANIQDGWVIYGLEEVEDGPIATSINFDENVDVALIGELRSQSEVITIEDDMFGIKLTKYKNEAVFLQSVKALKSGTELTGYVTFMTCDGERCLPPTDVDFNFVLD